LSQAEALWESKSQIAGLACQDIRYKGPVYQTVRQNNNNQINPQIYTHEKSRSRATCFAYKLDLPEAEVSGVFEVTCMRRNRALIG
jgi:hypothetical protein